MPKQVRLPPELAQRFGIDVVRDVPDDITQAELVDRLERKQRADSRAERIRSLAEQRPEEFDPTSPEFQERFGPTGSRLENFLAGVGRGVVDVGRGLRQVGVEAADLIPGVDLSQQAQQLREEQALVRERDAPLLGTGAGLAGNIAGNLVTTLLPAAGVARAAQAAGLARTGAAAGGLVNPATFGSAAASGAVQGAIAPVATGESRLANTAIGGAAGLAGQGLSRGFQRLAQPIRRALSPAGEDAVDILQREGVQLDAAQRTGSEAAQRVRSALFDNPLTAGRQRSFAETQQKQFTRAVLRTAGIDADDASPDVINNAFDKIGDAIDDAAAKRPARFDPTLSNDIASILERAPREAGDQSIVNSLTQNVDDLFSAVDASGAIPGPRFVGIRSSLSALSKKTPLARDLEEAMLEALERSGGARGPLKDALARFRNLKIIQDSLESGAERNISPLRLSTVLNQKRNRSAFQRGIGHESTVRLGDLARAGRSVLPQSLPQSGTTPRLVGEALLFGSGAGLAGLGGQDLETSLKIGAGAAALPLAVQRGLLNQGGTGRFLTQGLQNDLLRGLLQSPALNLATTQGAIQTGLAGSR